MSRSRLMMVAAALGAAAVCPLRSDAAAQGTNAAAVSLGAASFAQTGDQVRVTVWPQSAFGPPVTAVVNPEGIVIIPPIGSVPVSRIPIGQLRDTLLARIAKFIRQPEVDVQVLRRVTVNGAVLRPDIYYMDVSATLRDAIARAGGISEVGNRKKVSVVRDGARLEIPGWESDTSRASVLRSGDQVLVGRRSWLELNILPVASLSLATASFILSLKR